MSLSFCATVKKSLVNIENIADHCDNAELAALFSICASETDKQILRTDNINIAKRTERLLLRTNRLFLSAVCKQKGKQRQYSFNVPCAINLNNVDITRICCKKAYIRGVFLSVATITNPAKAYHVEFILKDEQTSAQITDILYYFGLNKTQRRGYSIYLKDSEMISDLLKIIEASDACLELTDTLIQREMNNLINRRVNRDTANYDKTASASAKHVIDIEYINGTDGLSSLPLKLREIAIKRIEFPEASLAELAAMQKPPISKSGANHRLRQIGEIAAKRRKDSFAAKYME